MYLILELFIRNVSLTDGSSALEDVEVSVDNESGRGGHLVY